MNFLILSAGTRNKIVQYFKKAINNEGLVVAEIELSDENEEYSIPEWVGEEVTSDIRYYNSNLMTNPYKNWKK